MDGVDGVDAPTVSVQTLPSGDFRMLLGGSLVASWGDGPPGAQGGSRANRYFRATRAAQVPQGLLDRKGQEGSLGLTGAMGAMGAMGSTGQQGLRDRRAQQDLQGRKPVAPQEALFHSQVATITHSKYERIDK